MKGKNILLCVTGGIAVYKAVALTSKLKQAGANVKVIMTKSACEFVTPLSFQAMSRNEVYIDTFDEKNPKDIAHIALADWADLVLVAPATANAIGKLANGIADNMVLTTLLATSSEVWIAPAMNVHMYDHPAVKRNIATLAQDGYRFIEPSEGYLACGYVGKGRLEEPEKIVQLVTEHFNKQPVQSLLQNKTVLITAGPTKEKIDPVRFLTNHSSGKMGFAFAEAAAHLGAHVILISSVETLPIPRGVTFVKVNTAEEMYQAVMAQYHQADIVVKSAAVADYRPKETHNQKMKKSDGELVIAFERTKDILLELGKKEDKPFLIGFAAETEQVAQYAKGKLERKNADMIVANDLSQAGAGFAGNTNVTTIFTRDGEEIHVGLKTKYDTAMDILQVAVKKLSGESK